MSVTKLKVGILGFGALGKHIYDAILQDESVSRQFEVCYVWNRTASVLEEGGVPEALREVNLENVVLRGADIVLEVAHPMVTVAIAAAVMRAGGNFMCGSPTCLADPTVEASLRAASSEGPGALYLPAGALWGASDLQALANRNGIASLVITMKKTPASWKLTSDEYNAKRLAAQDVDGEVVLYEGSVRELCPIAPNNVNTMACAAIAAWTLGFDNTTARMVCDRNLTTHEIEILVLGKPTAGGSQFRLALQRSSPSPIGAVTSKATYASFVESMRKSHGRGRGVHFV